LDLKKEQFRLRGLGLLEDTFKAINLATQVQILAAPFKQKLYKKTWKLIYHEKQI